MGKLQITKDVPCDYTGKKNEFIIWDSEGVAVCGVNNEDLAKLVSNSINTYQQCETLPSDLLRQNQQMREALEHVGSCLSETKYDNLAVLIADCLTSLDKGK